MQFKLLIRVVTNRLSVFDNIGIFYIPVHIGKSIVEGGGGNAVPDEMVCCLCNVNHTGVGIGLALKHG